MKRNQLIVLFALISFGGVIVAMGLQTAQRAEPWRPANAKVASIGLATGRSGRIDVHVKNATGYGVITAIRSDQVTCKVGDTVPVQQSGAILRGTRETCVWNPTSAPLN